MMVKKVMAADYSECGTYVHIWETTAKAVGHASIAIVDCSSDLSAKYMSIHPGQFPAIGPSVVLPIPAALSPSLDEDKVIEANYHQAKIPNQDEMVTLPQTDNTVERLDPDYTFHFSHLNVRSILAEMDDIAAKVKTGEVAYQLFPKVNAFGFFKDIPRFISYNPVDINGVKNKQVPSAYNPKVYNCATLVGHLLSHGGATVKESKTPWGQSPNELASQLYKMK